MTYTQRQWDRTVGWGTVPDEYNNISTEHTDGENKKRSDKTREEVLRTVKEIQEEWSLNDPRWDERWYRQQDQ